MAPCPHPRLQCRFAAIALARPDYDRHLPTSTGFPAVVLPTHWDNFRLPYGFSQEATVERNLVPFMETARRVSSGSRVTTPVHLEPIVIR